MTRDRSFLDLYAHGFARVAVAVPRVRLADPEANAEAIDRLHARAAERGAVVTLFPELCLTGYSLDDLHQQEAVQAAALAGLRRLARATAGRPGILVVGAPLVLEQRLFNCGVVLGGGGVLGVAPKSYLPAYREFYEKRQFSAARDALADVAVVAGDEVPVGTDLVFRAAELPDLRVHVEVCEDVWAPIPPSTYAALGGATVLLNLSASNVIVGKSGYRHQLAASQSAKTLSAYLYAAAGQGESTTDLAWDGEALVYEDGECLARAPRFAEGEELVLADVDLDRLVQERTRMTSFVDCATDHRDRVELLREVRFSLTLPERAFRLERAIERRPYVPADPAARDERCAEVYDVQVSGLAQRLRATGIEKVVIGVSGGLDSTQALLVCARTMDRLRLPRANVLAYTLPCFATSEETRRNAHELMAALGLEPREIDVRPSAQRMLEDIGHPAARGERVYDATYENVQAGERTSHLFRLANLHGAIVAGTSDLSELALGWTTYGVGDQMSHYAVNASIPKTLVRHLVEWEAERESDARTREVLRRILATRVSPELVPGDGEGPAQDTESAIGPFDLHDFSLYHVTRRGYGPAKVLFLATHAWARDLPGREGDSPYTCEDVARWLRVFLDRFFRTSQFKRSALPNAPKVGSGGSLSPRGDWRAPSDASSAAWLAALDAAWERLSAALSR